MGEIGARLGEAREGVAAGHGARAQPLDLREDEPHPVALLAPARRARPWLARSLRPGPRRSGRGRRGSAVLVWPEEVAMSLLYHPKNRALQEEFGSAALADRLEGMARTAFSDDDRAFIEGAIYFFLATADGEGRPDCSFKGGPAGFVRDDRARRARLPRLRRQRHVQEPGEHRGQPLGGPALHRPARRRPGACGWSARRGSSATIR